MDNKQNFTKTDKLSRRQQQMIVALLASRSVCDACRVMDISRAQFYTWLKSDDGKFKAAIDEAYQQSTNEGMAALKLNVEKAAGKLVSLIDAEDQNVSLRASVALLDFYLKAVESKELEKRIEALEGGHEKS